MKRTVKRSSLQLFNALFFAATVIVNALANSIPINGITTGEVSANIPNLFTPSGITFSIWAVIYILLLVFSLFQGQGIFRSKSNRETLVFKIGIWFILASVANITWIFAWHYQQFLYSLLCILLLLISLIMIYKKLKIGKAEVKNQEKYFAHLPFSIYLGWVTVATIANTAVVLVDAGWNQWGLSQEFWTITMISIASIITLIMIFLRNDLYFTLVIIWAFAGIIMKRYKVSPVDTLEIIVTAAIAIVLLIVALILNYLLYKKRY